MTDPTRTFASFAGEFGQFCRTHAAALWRGMKATTFYHGLRRTWRTLAEVYRTASRYRRRMALFASMALSLPQITSRDAEYFHPVDLGAGVEPLHRHGPKHPDLASFLMLAHAHRSGIISGSGLHLFEFFRPIAYDSTPIVLPQATAWGPGMTYNPDTGKIDGTAMDHTEPSWAVTTAFTDQGSDTANASALQSFVNTVAMTYAANTLITVPNTSLFKGSLDLPTTDGTFWIGIKPADGSMLPALSPGTSRGTYANRVDPSLHGQLPEFYPSLGGSGSPIKTIGTGGASSKKYYLRGLNVTARGMAAFGLTTLVNIATTGSTSITANYPEGVVLAQILFDGLGNGSTRRAVGVIARGVAVVDCYGDGIGQLGSDSQFVEMLYGQGPLKMHNCWTRIDGPAENIMVGGEQQPVGDANFQPTNIEITGNFLDKPQSGDYGWLGGADDKNWVEIKAGSQGVVDGNTCGYHDGGGQNHGSIIWLTDQTGDNPNTDTRDWVFTNNAALRGGPGLLSINAKGFTGVDNLNQPRRTWVANNVCGGLTKGPSNGVKLAGTSLTHIVIRWNTLVVGNPVDSGTAGAVTAQAYNSGDQQATTDVQYNILASPDDTGIFNDAYALLTSVGVGETGFDTNFSGSTFANNTVPGVHGIYARQSTPRPANRAALKFVDLAGLNFRLQGDSPCKGLGPLGQDYGVQWAIHDELQAKVLAP